MGNSIHSKEFNNKEFNEARYRINLQKTLCNIDRAIGTVISKGLVYYNELTILNIVYEKYLDAIGVRDIQGIRYINEHNVENLFDTFKLEQLNDIVVTFFSYKSFKSTLKTYLNRHADREEVGYILSAINIEEQRRGLITIINKLFTEQNYTLHYSLYIDDLIYTKDKETYGLVCACESNLFGIKEFKNASDEYAQAFKLFRQKDYNQAIISMCASLESVIKVICTKFKYNDLKCRGCAERIDVLVKNNYFDNYIDNACINFIVTSIKNAVTCIRNKADHGQGATPILMNNHTSEYVLYCGISAIHLLINIYNDKSTRGIT